MELELLSLKLEIYSIKTRSVCVSNPDFRRKRYRYSPSNRMKFQRKVMSKLNSSSSLLSQSEGERFYCPHEPCNKIYKLEGALRNHIKKVHGIEEITLSESKFEPTEASTATTVGEDNKKKRKWSSGTTEDELSEEENVEEAKRAKERRKDLVNQLNVERDLDLGYDVDDTLIGATVAHTQGLLEDLAVTIEAAGRGTNVKVNESVEAGPSGAFEDSMVNNNVDEVKILKDKIKDLTTINENQGTKILDLEVIIQEQNEQMDDKDRMLKEKRLVIKVKQEEIDELLKDKRSNNLRMKKSPVKEALKVEAEKAGRQLKAQTGRIRNLEKQNDELIKQVKKLEKDQPDVVKLKETVEECLDRAEHHKREREQLENTISHLKKKIPCPNAACEKGKRCQNSHVLKYSQQAGDTTKVPCVHYINDRCKYSAEECDFSHDEKWMSAKQRRQFLDVRRLEDVSEEDIEAYENYSKSADRYKKPLNKRRRVDSRDSRESGESYDTNATSNFPEPVPAYTKRSRSRTSNASSSTRYSGNSKGARTSRSSAVSPTAHGSRRGSRGSSRGSRGRGQRRRTRSRSPLRSRSPKQEGKRWDEKSRRSPPRRGSSRESRRHSRV